MRLRKRKPRTEMEVHEEGCRLADESAGNLQRLKDIAGQLNDTAERMALANARLHGEQ